METTARGDRVAHPRGILLGLERGLTAPYRVYRRARGWRRRALLALYGVVALAACVLVYREAAIAGLPAVADPFDVAAFEATTVSDDHNAFVLYREAIARVRTTDAGHAAPTLRFRPITSWATTDATARSWLEANREALELWRRGTERPEALDRSLATIRIGTRPDDEPYLFFQSMALLEALRLEEAGDMPGAWRWHIASLRFTRHFTRYANLNRRTLAAELYDRTAERVLAWANNPRTKAPELRKALGDLLKMESSPPSPASETFRVQYLAMMHALDDPDRFMREAEQGGSVFSHPYSEFRPWYQALWFLRNEPRRARRLVRLAFANWLSQCDKPLEARAPKVLNHPNYPIWFLYAPDPTAPAAARALPADRFFPWLETSPLASKFFPMLIYYGAEPGRERKAHAALIVRVAERLFEREHGRPPASSSELVGPYLPHMPEGYDEDERLPAGTPR